MRELSSSISVVPAKRKSTQCDTASRLLDHLELLRRELHALLEQDAHAALSLFERFDLNLTGQLSRDDFCTALEHLGIGEQLASTERVRTPLVRELRFALASACMDEVVRGVSYREPHLGATLQRPLDPAALALDDVSVCCPRKSYLSAQRGSRLLRAAQRQDDAERKASTRALLPKLDIGRARALLGDAQPDSAYMSVFNASLNIEDATRRLGGPSTMQDPAALDLHLGASLAGQELNTRRPSEEDRGRHASPGQVAELPPIRMPRAGAAAETTKAVASTEGLNTPAPFPGTEGRARREPRTQRRGPRQSGIAMTLRFPPTLRELGSASEMLLRALQADPCHGEAQRELNANMVRFKHDATPWMQWPYEPKQPQQEQPGTRQPYRRRVREKPRPLEPPARIGPPVAFKCTANSIAFRWPEHAPRHPHDHVHNYELEVSEVSLLDGLLPFVLVNALDADTVDIKTSHVVRKMLPLTAVRARVRAVNQAGAGPWSEVGEACTLDERGRPPRVPLSEVPPDWRRLDLDDVYKQNKKETDGDGIVTAEERAEQQAAIDLVTTRHMGPIKIAYRYYCLVGASGGASEPDGMGMTQFLAFCKATQLVNKAHPNSFGFDRLFIRATRPPDSGILALVDVASGVLGNESTGLSSRLRAAHAVDKLVKRTGQGEKQMKQHQFVAALVRLAAQHFPATPIGEALDRLIETRLVDHVRSDLRLESDDFSEIMQSRLMQTVLRKHRRPLLRSFDYYAGVDQSMGNNTVLSLGTINLREMRELCADLNLLDARFGMRDMLSAFVRVNIDDELFEQEEEGNMASELVFDEYQEMVGRIFFGRMWLHMGAAERSGKVVEREFDAWLSDFYIPAVLETIKAKRPNG